MAPLSRYKPELKQKWDALLEENPRTRIRDAAESLNVSEMELLATGISDNVTLLEGDFKALFAEFTKMGKVMSLVRNDIAVHELSAEFPEIKFHRHPDRGVAFSDIDLRINFAEYRYAFASQNQHANQTLRSIQFFDKSGAAIHKVYLKNRDHTQQWDQMVADYTANSTPADFDLMSAVQVSTDFVPVDVDAFKQAWLAMQDVHDMQNVLNEFGLSRLQGLQAIGDSHAWQVELDAIKSLIEQVSAQNISAMVFVSNHAVTQIYSGPFKQTKEMGPWMNVLDPNFNLHVLTSAVGQVWVVKKPTSSGILTSLEVYDKNGTVMMFLTPKRAKNEPEPQEWSSMLEALPKR
jgi:putative hemin transport protein